MYFSTTTTIALVSALSFSSATPHLSSRQSQDKPRGVVCETTAGSPDAANVAILVDSLKQYEGGRLCGAEKEEGTGCQGFVVVNNAEFAVCVEEGYDGVKDTCNQVGAWAGEIQQKCLKDGKVGGYYIVNENKKINVLHSGYRG